MPYLLTMSQAGRRIAELHVALAGNSELPEFAPEPIGRDDIQHWIDDLLARAGRICDALRQRRDALKEPERVLAYQLLALQPTLAARLEKLLPQQLDGANIRGHGDLDLSQMLIAKDDIFIVDFKGEPGRTIAERRRKAPAARDVASLLRSIDYSATMALERAQRVAQDEHGKLAAALAHLLQLIGVIEAPADGLHQGGRGIGLDAQAALATGGHGGDLAIGVHGGDNALLRQLAQDFWRRRGPENHLRRAGIEPIERRRDRANAPAHPARHADRLRQDR